MGILKRSVLESNLLKDFVDPHLTIVAGREFQGLTTRQEKKLCLIDECASGTSSRSSWPHSSFFSLIPVKVDHSS